MTDNVKIAVGIGVVVAAFVGGKYIYDQGKKKNVPVDLGFDIETGQIVDVHGNVTQEGGSLNSTPASSEILERIAGEMFHDMNGLNLGAAHNIRPYQDALALSNVSFTAVYNVFNAKYQGDSGQTLTEWIASEDALMFSPWEYIQTAMINRLNSLNLP